MKDRPVRIACFGDSLTEGYGIDPDDALPMVMERMLREEGYAARCLNHGISGETAEDGRRRLNSVLGDSPDAMVLEFGANDCFVSDPVNEINNNLSAIIEAFQARSTPILLVGISALTNFDGAYQESFNPIFRQLANKYALPLFPDILAPYFGKTELMLLDQMHPNEQGVAAIARGLLPQMIELVNTASQ